MKSRVLILDRPVALTASALEYYRTAAVLLVLHGQIDVALSCQGDDYAEMGVAAMDVLKNSFGVEVEQGETIEQGNSGVVFIRLTRKAFDPSKFMSEGAGDSLVLGEDGVLRLSSNPLRAMINLFAPVISRAYHGETATVELVLDGSLSNLDEIALRQFVGSMMTALGVNNVDLHFVRGGATASRRFVYQLILQPKTPPTCENCGHAAAWRGTAWWCKNCGSWVTQKTTAAS